MDIKESLYIYFNSVEDPRSQAHITYQLSDILFLLIIEMLCNCTDLEMIIEFFYRLFSRMERIKKDICSKKRN